MIFFLKTTLRIIVALTIFISLFPSLSFSQRSQDSLALVALYNATDGPNWTNTWDLRQPMDTWYGVALNANGRVKRLWLDSTYFPHCPQCVNNGNNLTGSIPEEIGFLADLKELSLAANSLAGSIPSTIGNLAQLEVLNLSGNFRVDIHLSGTIPEEIRQLTQLRYLEIRYQELTGMLPSFIAQLTDLMSIEFGGNNLEGLVPDLSTLKKLESFSIWGNNFQGNFPEWIPMLSSLKQIGLDDNNFVGEIPLAIGNLSQLRVFTVNSNEFTGSIPPGLGNIPSMNILDFSDNQFTGSIPANYSQLRLHRFDIRNNRITGSVPAFQQGDNPLYINVIGSQLTFSDILPSIEQISANYDYRFSPQQKIYQQTTINPELGEQVIIDLGIDEGLSSNAYTWFKDDQFYTRMVGNNNLVFQNITANDAGVYRCEVTNPNAPDLTIISHAITLQIKSNACQNDSLALVAIYNATGGPNWNNTWDLSQPVHTWYGVTLNSSGCVTRLQLVSQISDCFCSFDGNNLSGTLPDDIWNLSELTTLDLFKNNLNYTLPEDIDKLNFKHLALGYSGLNGPIPTSLNNLTQLEYLDLSDSNLSEIPYLGSLQQLRSLYLVLGRKRIIN